MSDSGYDFLFKAIVCGDGGVGKTALTIRFTKGFFEKEYKLTIGVDFHIKTIEVETDEGLKRCKLQLWDTGGQERFSSVRPMYYRGALGALLVFDLTNQESFDHLPNWIEEIKSNTKADIPMLLIANKSDLVDEREVSKSEIEDFCTKFNSHYLETSAKSGNHVGDCFAVLAFLMMGIDVPQELLGQKELISPEMIAARADSIPVSSFETPYIQPLELNSSPEPSYEAPPVPEPKPAFIAPPVPEPEPEPAFIAPPVPEPEPAFIAPPIPEPEPAFIALPIPEPEPEPIYIAPPVPAPKPQPSTPSEESFPILGTSSASNFAPKSVPFSSKAPTPVPAPLGFKPVSDTPISMAIPSKEPAPFTLSKTTTPKPEPEPEPEFTPAPTFQAPAVPEPEPQQPIIFSGSSPSEAPTLTKYLPQNAPSSDSFLTSLSTASKKKGKEKKKVESPSSFVPFMTSKQPKASEKSAPLMIIPNAEEIKKKQKEKKKGKVKEKAKTKDKVKERADPEPVPAPEVRKEKKKDVVICRQCGAILSKEFMFCNRCGAHLS